MLRKNTSQCKIFVVPEEGWFGQPKYSTPLKKEFYVVWVSAFIFFRLFNVRSQSVSNVMPCQSPAESPYANEENAETITSAKILLFT